MATLNQLTLDADGTITAAIRHDAGTGAPFFSHCNDAPDGGSSDFVENNDAEQDGEAWFRLTDVNSDLGIMDTLNIDIDVLAVGFNNDTCTLTARIFRDDNDTTFPLTAETATLGSHADSTRTQRNVAFSSLFGSRGQWNSAYIRFTWTYNKVTGPDNANLQILGCDIDGTYTIGETATPDAVAITASVPTVVTTVGLTETPSPLVTTASVPAVVTVGGTITETPSPVVTTATVPAVVAFTTITEKPEAVAFTSKAVAANPLLINIQTAIVTTASVPAVTTTGDITETPSPVVTTSSVVVPALDIVNIPTTIVTTATIPAVIAGLVELANAVVTTSTAITPSLDLVNIPAAIVTTATVPAVVTVRTELVNAVITTLTAITPALNLINIPAAIATTATVPAVVTVRTELANSVVTTSTAITPALDLVNIPTVVVTTAIVPAVVAGILVTPSTVVATSTAITPALDLINIPAAIVTTATVPAIVTVRTELVNAVATTATVPAVVTIRTELVNAIVTTSTVVVPSLDLINIPAAIVTTATVPVVVTVVGGGITETPVPVVITATVPDVEYVGGSITETPIPVVLTFTISEITTSADEEISIPGLGVSYASTTFASVYFGDRLHTEAWDLASLVDRKKALTQGTEIIDRLRFVGEKNTAFLAREAGNDHETIVAAAATQIQEFPRGADTVVPNDIKIANSLIALSLLDDVDPEEETANLPVVSQGAASFRTTYDRSWAPEHLVAGIPSAAAWFFIRPYVRNDREVDLHRVN